MALPPFAEGTVVAVLGLQPDVTVTRPCRQAKDPGVSKPKPAKGGPTYGTLLLPGAIFGAAEWSGCDMNTLGGVKRVLVCARASQRLRVFGGWNPERPSAAGASLGQADYCRSVRRRLDKMLIGARLPQLIRVCRCLSFPYPFHIKQDPVHAAFSLEGHFSRRQTSYLVKTL